MNQVTTLSYNKVLITNLDPEFPESELKATCQDFGQVISLQFFIKGPGVHGFAMVEFANQQESEKCVLYLNGRKLGEKVVHVEMLTKVSKKAPENVSESECGACEVAGGRSLKTQLGSEIISRSSRL